MTSVWAPEHWDDFSTVGLLVFVVAFHFVAYLRRWIIPGSHHREIVDARDREIEQAQLRSAEDVKTIRVQATALAEKEATNRLLEALKEAMGK